MTLAEEQISAPADGSAAPEPSAPNVVKVGDATIVLHPEVTIPIGVSALSVIRQGGSQAAIEAGLADVYLRFGIESWSYPEPVTPENIARLLPYADGGLEVAEVADSLYTSTVMRPLRRRYPALFQTGQTEPSTPATLGSGSTPVRPSTRSSRNGTAGRRSRR